MDQSQFERLKRIFGYDSLHQPESIIPLLFNQAPKQADMVADMIKARFSHPPVQSLLSKLSPENTLAAKLLQTIQPPTLLIWGQQDRIFPGMADFFKQNLPSGTQILEPAHFTHSPYIEGNMDQELSDMMFTWASQLKTIN